MHDPRAHVVVVALTVGALAACSGDGGSSGDRSSSGSSADGGSGDAASGSVGDGGASASPPVDGFSFTVAPPEVTVMRGGGAAAAITIQRGASFTGTIGLTSPTAPPGLSVSAGMRASGDGGTLYVTALPDAPLGTFSVPLELRSGSVRVAGALQVHVVAGALDPTFGAAGLVVTDIAGGTAAALALQPDGKLVVAGSAAPAGKSVVLVARYLADGTPDAAFGTNGLVTSSFGAVDDVANGVALQADGKIVVVGLARGDSAKSLLVARYDTAGALDPTFAGVGWLTLGVGSLPTANAVLVQPDGKIVVAGTAIQNGTHAGVLARVGSDGALDGTFPGGGIVLTGTGRINALVRRSDGALVSAGWRVARFLETGAIDGTFTSGAPTDSQRGGLALASDQKILTSGKGGAFTLERLLADGAVDSAFASAGVATVSFGTGARAHAVTVQPDGKIVAVGRTATNGSDFAVSRHLSTGALDTAFGLGGTLTTSFPATPASAVSDDAAHAVAVQADGKIVVAGSTKWGFGATKVALARYAP